MNLETPCGHRRQALRIGYPVLLVLAAAILPSRALATAQVPDILVCPGQRYPLYANPLEDYIGQGHPRLALALAPRAKTADTAAATTPTRAGAESVYTDSRTGVAFPPALGLLEFDGVKAYPNPDAGVNLRYSKGGRYTMAVVALEGLPQVGVGMGTGPTGSGGRLHEYAAGRRPGH